MSVSVQNARAEQPATIVVGAGPGVGVEVARRFGRAGHRVGVVRRDAAALDRLVAELQDEGVSAEGIPIDVSRSADLRSGIERFAESAGRLDVLHYNVPGPLGRSYRAAVDVDEELMRENLDARVIGALVAIQAALPSLRASRGAALFTAGASDLNPYPTTAAIGVPQAALRMYARHLHDELADEGVFVGYLPIAHPPVYRDESQELQRTDFPKDVRGGLNAAGRVTAADVAEAHFQLAQRRDTFEWRLGTSEIGLADRH